MEVEDNRVRISVGSALVVIGSALMSRLPQLLPEQVSFPWYQDRYLLSGILIVFIGLLVLIVPNRCWGYIWRLVRYSPKTAYRFYLWKRYGPTYTISKPNIESFITDNISPPRTNYKAQFTVSIKNKGKPLKLRLNYAHVVVEQVTEWAKRGFVLGNLPRQSESEIEFKPKDEKSLDLVVYASPRDVALKNPPDLLKPYKCYVQGICVTLPKAGERELRKMIMEKGKPIKLGK